MKIKKVNNNDKLINIINDGCYCPILRTSIGKIDINNLNHNSLMEIVYCKSSHIDSYHRRGDPPNKSVYEFNCSPVDKKQTFGIKTREFYLYFGEDNKEDKSFVKCHVNNFDPLIITVKDNE